MRSERYGSGQILDHLGIRRPPVDVEAIAGEIGVRVVSSAPDSRWDGVLVVSEEGPPEIRVNGGYPRDLRRFAIAHELGHLMLHSRSRRVFRDAAGVTEDTPEERQANRFAVSLLMPAWMVQRVGVEFGVDVPALARIFDVSQEAVCIQLRNLYL